MDKKSTRRNWDFIGALAFRCFSFGSVSTMSFICVPCSSISVFSPVSSFSWPSSSFRFPSLRLLFAHSRLHLLSPVCLLLSCPCHPLFSVLPSSSSPFEGKSIYFDEVGGFSSHHPLRSFYALRAKTLSKTQKDWKTYIPTCSTTHAQDTHALTHTHTDTHAYTRPKAMLQHQVLWRVKAM